MYCILIYDIAQDNRSAYVTRNVFKVAKKYLIHIQKSIFEGELDYSQYLNMTNELKNYLRYDLDSCIIFYSRNKKWLSKNFLTKENDDTSNFF